MNRVIENITTLRRNLGTIDPGLSSKLDMSFEEYCKFQELKSLAVASGVLSLEEGQVVYALLGSIPDDFNNADVATKIVLTKLFAQLLEARCSPKK